MVKSVIFDMYETLVTLFESPPYFGTQIAQDCGIAEEVFQSIWGAAEFERTIGKLTLEEVIERILRVNDIYSEEKLKEIVDRRTASKVEAFRHLHPEIIPMLQALKKQGIRIGLITNCFSEEVTAIRSSELYPYFDAVCFSYEEELMKPDPAIFRRCLEKLNLAAKECLYVGDGGSHELEAARETGMACAQAVWYLKEGTRQPAKRKPEFIQLESPLGVLELIG